MDSISEGQNFRISGHDRHPRRIAPLTIVSEHFIHNQSQMVFGTNRIEFGWLRVSGPPGLCAQAQARLDLIADTYLSVSTPVQQATEKLLAGRDMIQNQINARIAENSRFLAEHCTGLARVLRREGGWYAVLETETTIPDEELVYQLLEHDNVFVHPGYFFDFADEHFIVVSLLTPSLIFQTGISKLLSRLNL